MAGLVPANHAVAPAKACPALARPIAKPADVRFLASVSLASLLTLYAPNRVDGRDKHGHDRSIRREGLS